jgi:hypothetical protein
MTANSIYIAIILVMIVIIIAFFAWRSWKKRHGADGFSYTTPATPRVREAVSDLFASLKQMVALGREFECSAERVSAAPQLAVVSDAASIAGARLSACQMIAALDNAEKGLSGAPPTYANYLAIYRGLTSTDVELLNAADAYTNAGYQVHQAIARAQGLVTCSGPAPGGDLADLGNALKAMGSQLRRVVAAVHRLGVALDVE